MENWWPAVAALGGFGTFSIGFITMWVRIGSRISTVEAKAESAHQKAEDMGDALTNLSNSYNNYREQIAKEYINRDGFREIEERLTASIDRLGNRLDTFAQAVLKVGH